MTTNQLRVTIIGWYGTETIGDRAILAGIVRLLSELSSEIIIDLGSLYPILTERTIRDDESFLKKCAHDGSLTINQFDSQSRIQLEKSIKGCDALIIGGGPLMDIEQMFMLEYAIRFAKKKKKKTIALGCGYGTLKMRKTIDCAQRILNLVDLSIMRDNNAPIATVSNMVDPAAFACIEYLENMDSQKGTGYYAVNLRDVFSNENHYPTYPKAEEHIIQWLSVFAEQSKQTIFFVPMHTFSVGFDDRVYLDSIAKKINSPFIEVISTPPSLQGTMDLFYNAELCFGMRFHAILFQTILNGNNFIFDYTHPQTGKIISLMKQLNMEDFYQGRYYSLYNNEGKVDFDLHKQPFSYSKELISYHFATYVNSLKTVFSE